MSPMNGIPLVRFSVTTQNRKGLFRSFQKLWTLVPICQFFTVFREHSRYSHCISLVGIMSGSGDKVNKAHRSTFVSRPNPVTGKMDWTLQADDYDYQQEIARSGYGDMLHDKDRNVKYYAAIRAAVELLKSQGKRVKVLDIGTGTGLLSMMAVEAGADTVTACEAFFPMAECAQKVIAANKMTDRIKLVKKRSTEVLLGEDLPERANLLVTELFDTELIGEGAIHSYTDAHTRLMEEDCLAVPTLSRIFIQAVQCDTLDRFNTLQPLPLPGGRTLSVPQSFIGCSGAPSLHDLQVDELEGRLTLVSEPAQVFSFDFSRRDAMQREEQTTVNLKSLVNGQLDAFVMYWDLQMDPQSNIWLSCGPRWVRSASQLPAPWRDHWMQAVYYPANPLPVTQNQTIDVYCNHDEYSLWFDTVDTNSQRPICSCGLHITFSRGRLGMLNNQQAIQTYTAALEKVITPNSVCLVVSEGSLLPLVAAALGPKKVLYLDTNTTTRRIIRKLIEENKMSDCVQVLDGEPGDVIEDHLDKAKIDIVIADPFTMAACLPWEHIYFWYALSALRPHLSPDCIILPRAMEVHAMPLQFRDLHKIRAPVGICEGFDISHFDNLIESSSDSADPNIEPQPLWEYPAKGLGGPRVVSSLDFTKPVREMSIKEEESELVCSRSGTLNGVAFWTEFDFGKGLTIGHGVEQGDWEGDKVRWDMFSRQGVHLLGHGRAVKDGAKIGISSTFSPSTGDLAFSINCDQVS